MDAPSFRCLLYRYWCFGWLFRDVARGTPPERAAAWRHNQASARWLPVYLWRWACLGALCFAAGMGLEPVAPPLLQAALYVPSAITVPVGAVTLAAWAGLKLLPGPL